jgi:hypothetical protein
VSHVACLGDRRRAHRGLVRGQKTLEKKQLGRSRLKLQNNTKISLQEVEWGTDWINPTPVFIKCGEFLE